MPVYINALASYLPDTINIETCDESIFDELKIPFSSKKTLIEGGYERLSCNKGDMSHIVSALLNKICSTYQGSFDEIDGIIICTESFHAFAEGKEAWDVEVYRTWLTKQLAAVGIKNAAIYGNWGQGCGNAATALMLAHSLINSQTARQILCLFFDQHPKSSNRIIDGTNLRGDGGAALIVSANEGSIILKNHHHYSDFEMSTNFYNLDFFNRYLLIKKMISKAIQSFESRYKVKINDYASVVMDSFHDMYIQLLAEDMKLKSVITPSKKKGGHIPPVDTILGLEHFLDNKDGASGPKFLAINIGRFSVGFFEFSVH